MKRLLFPVLCALSVFVSQCEAKEKLMSIQIKKGSLRSTPTFLGKISANVRYGDRVSVVETQGDWTKVSPIENGTSGWIHKSALSKKRILLNSGAKQDLAASSGELALAGKGFNSDVEAKFKADNKDIDFTWIDKMERIKLSSSQMQAFLAAGKVSPKGGAK